MTATATTPDGKRHSVAGQTVSEIEKKSNAIGAIRIAWPWAEVWRMIAGEWVSM